MSADIQRPIPPIDNRPYVSVIRAGDWVYTAGYTGTRSDGSAPPELAEQYRLIIEKAERNLAQAGATLDQAVHVTVYLTDMADYAEMNRCFRQSFRDAPPARTCVRVASLTKPDKRLEMQFVLFTGDSKPK